MTNRPPPCDMDAERYVLGCTLRKGELFATAAARLTTADFYNSQHRIVWQAMVALLAAGVEIDVVSVGHHLRNANALEAVGGAVYLSELLDNAVTTVHLKRYIETVKGLARRRAAIQAARQLIEEAHNTDTDTDTMLAAGQALIANATADISRGGPEPLANLVGPAHEEALRPLDKSDSVKTGIGRLDTILGGLWPGILTVLAARTSMGKSCLALNIAVNAGLAGRQVLLFSMEDTKKIVIWRIFARLGNVPMDAIMGRRIDEERGKRLDGAREIVGCLPVHVDDRNALSPEQVRYTATAHRSRHGLDLLIVDLLGGLRTSGRSLYEQTTAAVQEIAAIPRELGCACLLVHQLNREVDATTHKIPSLSHLRQSGEHTARVVIFLMRPAYYREAYPDANDHDLQCYIAKNSHGPTGKIDLWCDMPTMTIQDQEPRRGY